MIEIEWILGGMVIPLAGGAMWLGKLEQKVTNNKEAQEKLERAFSEIPERLSALEQSTKDIKTLLINGRDRGKE